MLSPPKSTRLSKRVRRGFDPGEITLFFREFMLAVAMSACRCDYLADFKPTIEQRLSKWVRRGFDPREISTSYAPFLSILAEYDKRGTDPLGSSLRLPTS